MAEVIIQNMRNPNQIVNVMVTLKLAVVQPESEGEQMWVLEGSVNEKDIHGNYILPVKKWISNKSTLSSDVNDLIDSIAKQVVWDYVDDTTPPTVVSHWPTRDAEGVPPDTLISISLEEEIPSAGIDLSSIRVKVKGFDLTDQVTVKGDIHACTVSLTPGTKFMSAVNEDFANGTEYPTH